MNWAFTLAAQNAGACTLLAAIALQILLLKKLQISGILLFALLLPMSHSYHNRLKMCRDNNAPSEASHQEQTDECTPALQPSDVASNPAPVADMPKEVPHEVIGVAPRLYLGLAVLWACCAGRGVGTDHWHEQNAGWSARRLLQAGAPRCEHRRV